MRRDQKMLLFFGSIGALYLLANNRGAKLVPLPKTTTAGANAPVASVQTTKTLNGISAAPVTHSPHPVALEPRPFTPGNWLYRTIYGHAPPGSHAVPDYWAQYRPRVHPAAQTPMQIRVGPYHSYAPPGYKSGVLYPKTTRAPLATPGWWAGANRTSAPPIYWD